ncbi:MAG: hypothetical protein EA391_06285 [Balneolaceae bacterium]|nr:MAG: hypothetical protein EA391_06285 [Balneolaceae bacterium]
MSQYAPEEDVLDEQKHSNNKTNVRVEENPEEEVDIWNLVRIIWAGRKIVLLFALAFLLLGLFHISTGPTEYTSDAVLLQESSRDQSNTQRLLQQFGGFGFNTSSGGSTDMLGPGMYPTIVSSIEFQRELIAEPIEFSRFDNPITLYEFFVEHHQPPFRDKVYSFIRNYTIQLPFRIVDWITNISFTPEEPEEEIEVEQEIDSRVLILSRREASTIAEVSGRISLSIDGNIITVNTTMPDRKAAAMLNVQVIEQIQEYVTNYKIEKARQNVEFTENRLVVAEERYEEAQRALAEFRDQNINLATNIARTEEERLANHRDRMFNVYNSLSVELEQARLRLQEETPLFSIMQKSSVPTRSLGSSNRAIVVFVILGVIFGFLFIFGRLIFIKLKEEVFDKETPEKVQKERLEYQY